MQKDQQQTAIIQPLDATDTVESSVDALAQGEAENAEVAEFNRLMRERETRKKSAWCITSSPSPSWRY